MNGFFHTLPDHRRQPALTSRWLCKRENQGSSGLSLTSQSRLNIQRNGKGANERDGN